MKKILIVVAVIGVLVAALVVTSIVKFAAQEEQAAGFGAHVPSYANEELADATAGGAYLLGRVVVVDVDRAAIDSFTYPRLPPALQATTPAEVRTVVRIRWTKEKVGVYREEGTGRESGDAFRYDAAVSVVDWEKRTVVAERSFRGEDPLRTVRADGDHALERPMFEVLKYLESLPRR